MTTTINELLPFTRPLRVLFIEDNRLAREYTHTMLKRFFTHVTVATNGEEGLRLFKEYPFEIIITDIEMPKMDGLEMIRQIRAINSTIPIVIISAYSEKEVKSAVKELKVFTHMVKPVTLSHLINLFKTLIHSTQTVTL